MDTSKRHGRAAFTLVEMLAVIVIILILAGVVVGGMGFVNDKQARDKANVQIKLLENAIEEYKLDKGVYPPGKGSTDGIGESNELFLALYWDSDADESGADQDTDQKIYLPELAPGINGKPNPQGWIEGSGATAKIIDPWQSEYRYRSGKLENGSENTSSRNPDFDLWSAGKDKKTKPDPKNADNKDDITNFQ